MAVVAPRRLLLDLDNMPESVVVILVEGLIVLDMAVHHDPELQMIIVRFKQLLITGINHWSSIQYCKESIQYVKEQNGTVSAKTKGSWPYIVHKEETWLEQTDRVEDPYYLMSNSSNIYIYIYISLYIHDHGPDYY